MCVSEQFMFLVVALTKKKIPSVGTFFPQNQSKLSIGLGETTAKQYVGTMNWKVLLI